MKIAILFEEEAAYQRRKERESRASGGSSGSTQNGDWVTEFEFGDDEDVEEMGMQPINMEDYR